MKKPHSKALKPPEWQTTNRNMMNSVSMCVFHTVGWSAVANLCLLCPLKIVIRKGPKYQHRKFPVVSKMLFESQHNILRNEHVGTCNTPWSAQISIQEHRWKIFLGILRKKGQMTLKVKVNNYHIQYSSQENIKMHTGCKFGDSSSNLLQVIVQTNPIS